MTITVVSATANLIDVTYELYESDGTTLVSSVVKEQEENSAIEVPSSLTAPTYYDYATEGTIGTEDCTIKVTRTLKSGYVISLDGLSNSKCYNIRNNRGTWAVGSGATVVNSTVELGLAFSASDTKQQFAFITYEGNVYLYSVGEGKFAYIDGTKLSLTADVTSAVAASPVTFEASTNSTYMYSEPIIVTVNGSHFGVSTGFSPDVFKYQSAGDGGNCAYIIEAGSFDATSALAALGEYFHPSYFVTYIVKDASNNTLFTSEPVATTNGATVTTLPAEYQRPAFYTYNTVNVTISTSGNTNVEFIATPKDDAPVKFTADTTNPYYYNLSIRSKYLVYNSEATGQVTLQNESEPFNADASWAFIGNPYAFKLINKTKGTGDFLTYTSVVIPRHSDNNVQFVSSDNFTDQYWTIDTNTNGIVFRMKNNTSIYFHHDSGKNYLRTCSVTEWSAVHNDAGSTIVASTDEDVLIALYEELSGLSIGEYYGQYYSTSSEMTNAQAEQTISLVGQLINNSQTAGYADAYAALLQVKTNLAQKVPAAGFYRLKNVATGKYLNTVKATNSYNSTDRGVYANGGAVDASTIIELREQSNGTLFMYNQGYGYGWVIAGGEVGRGVVFATSSPDKYVHWFPGNEANQVAFAICYGNGEGSYASYLTKGIFTVDTDDNSVIGGTDYTIDAAQWVIEEATSATVALNAGGDGNYYATAYLPFDATVAEAAAYTLALNGAETALTMTELTDGKVPAGTPVFLKGTAGTATVTINTGDAFAAVEKGDLTGTYTDLAVSGGTDYFLGKVDGKVGFYHWAGSTLKANRAYFEASKLSSTGAKGFALDFEDDATGIDDVNANLNDSGNLNEAIYNLAGQRLNKMQKGINIINGKKILK